MRIYSPPPPPQLWRTRRPWSDDMDMWVHVAEACSRCRTNSIPSPAPPSSARHAPHPPPCRSPCPRKCSMSSQTSHAPGRLHNRPSASHASTRPCAHSAHRHPHCPVALHGSPGLAIRVRGRAVPGIWTGAFSRSADSDASPNIFPGESYRGVRSDTEELPGPLCLAASLHRVRVWSADHSRRCVWRTGRLPAHYGGQYLSSTGPRINGRLVQHHLARARIGRGE
jgi:hypothetical protein